MKKLIMSILCAGILAVGSTNAMNDGGPGKKHKAVRTTEKGVNKGEKGVKHVAYDATHNKVTKDAKVNNGNKEYKHKKDIK